ncbi:MAG: 30S ribosomal protein S16 [Candidatus Eisenbacteria bacterium]|uniref:Small ribosomal subunit protein bS16 n=1 Tax=Eiseniibacteriota bacterium TaxID=2212470 RepID=A0A538TAL6_UNCEI|nr:MAG: 30S ribosomal protein S16 [Candidatus Eisenbacteria bacterium]
MSVVIRMKRAGAKKRPFYRVVVADSRFARDGRYIEQLGYYDPLTEPAKFHVDAGRFEQWIRRGARPSESVGVMMAKHAPGALRPAPLPLEPRPEGAEVKAPEAKPKKAKKAKGVAKAARKAKPVTKGSQKKAKTRAKAKAKKATGGPKAKAAKKPKK